MKDIAIRFLWKAPIERLFIGVLLVAIFFLWKKAEASEAQYQAQLIECAKVKDSLRVYYNHQLETELRERIARYDAFIEDLKSKSHEKE